MDLKGIVKRGSFDLHIHSTASDGIYSPKQLVAMAKERGLKTIAITDHDTLEGIQEAKTAGDMLGVNVIGGVEISTKYQSVSLDILGYFVDPTKQITETLLKLRMGRKERAHLMIKKLNDMGVGITISDVMEFSGGSVIARPHIAQAVVKKGYEQDHQTVFDEYIGDGRPCAVDKVILSPRDAVQLIREAGGMSVLAHPKYVKNDELVREVLMMGLDGLEVWHRDHTTEEVEKFKKMAEEFGLLMTGGSDFHNDNHILGKFN
ncbi:PHP domain-containing protein [Evansella tamaricis]|uniref:PHP domain-containing protein n=1 Tax=Evansella tamaricis TaxID=2069301 RepID=A0ABS6JI26_9BACI|nr:PHP domain-containing protein [Evansella tamaricis]MBU9713324.1 PHP domain-containing protein [Evansella tamaricis]